MTPEEARGRRIVLAIVSAMVAINILSSALMFMTAPPEGRVIVILMMTVSIATCWCLYMGYRWARAYIPVVLLLSGLSGIARAIGSTNLIGGALAVTLGVVYISAAVVLWTSPSVGAHFSRQSRPREGVLSLNDDGV